MYAVQNFFAVALHGATSGLVNSGHYVWKQGFPERYRGCVLNQHELKAGVVVPVLGQENPRRQLHALDEDHVCLSRPVPHVARFAVFLAIEPLFGAVR